MATITLDPRSFLQKKELEDYVNVKLETDLQFINLFDIVPTDATSVAYTQDLTTAGDDYDAGTTGKPFKLGELSELPEIEVSPVTQKQGMLQPYGFKVAVSDRDMRRSEIIDDLKRTVDRGTYSMARYMDDEFISVLEANSNDITEVNGATVWSDDAAEIATDIISFQEAFDIAGYNFQLTDLFVDKTNFYEAKKYFVDYMMSRSGNPEMIGDQDSIDTGLGTILRRARSASIAHGGYLGLDTRPGFKPATVYAYRDPSFGNSAEFPLINIFQYKEEAYPHRTITEFVSDLFPAIKEPNAACYKSTGI